MISGQQALMPKTHQPNRTGTTMRILIVDDSEDSRDLTEGALLSAGYKDVAAAGSAQDAFKLLAIGGPGGAPCDLRPDPARYRHARDRRHRGLRRIRSDNRYGDIPIIMISALADMDSLSNAFIAGATTTSPSRSIASSCWRGCAPR